MNRKIVVAVIAVVVILLLLWWLRQPDDAITTTQPAEPPAALPAEPAPTPRPEPVVSFDEDPAATVDEEPIVEAPPALANSDEPAQAAAADLSSDLVRWITPQEKVRKLVLLVDLAASGRVPVKNRPVSYSAGEFKVDERDGDVYLDESNYERASQLIEVVTAIPPANLVRYYRSWQPLLEEAYAELGRNEPFDQRLEKAMAEVLATQPLEGDIELAQPSVYYTYADPQLERASDVSKLMWRIGPENTRKLQDYIRQLQPLLEANE